LHNLLHGIPGLKPDPKIKPFPSVHDAFHRKKIKAQFKIQQTSPFFCNNDKPMMVWIRQYHDGVMMGTQETNILKIH